MKASSPFPKSVLVRIVIYRISDLYFRGSKRKPDSVVIPSEQGLRNIEYRILTLGAPVRACSTHCVVDNNGDGTFSHAYVSSVFPPCSVTFARNSNGILLLSSKEGN